MTNLVEMCELSVSLVDERTERPILVGVDLQLEAGTALGLVGESGSGKTTTARSIIGALPRSARASGRIYFDTKDVLSMSSAELQGLRARSVAVIGQNPQTAMNPLRRVGDFATESLRRNRGVAASEARLRLVGLLGEIGIHSPERVLDQYPHQLSGGMLQRVVIAAAVAAEPELVIADEPTSALDVTTQADVLAILGDLCRTRSVAMLLITHDLDMAAAVCDRTAVMYAGRIVEESPSQVLQEAPRHPYTVGLAAARTRVDVDIPRLAAIPGRPIAAFGCTQGCPFAPRCALAEPRCHEDEPPLTSGDRRVACWQSAECVELAAAIAQLAPEVPND